MRKVKIIIIYSLVLILSNCTKNPFGNNEENNLHKEKISGTINLEDGVIPNDVFVWLETINLSTYTDEEGKFSITIPLPENQSGGTGFDGKFTLYFFMGNYRVDSLDIEFTQGKFLEDQDNISNKGELRNIVTLKPLINFQTTSFHECIILDDYVELKIPTDSLVQLVNINIQIYDETQVIFSLRQDRLWPEKGFWRTGMIFEPVDDKYEPVLIESPDAFNYHNALLLNTNNTWTFELMLYQNDFEETVYDVYPYIIVFQPQVPEGLWDALGREKIKYGIDYLKFPIKKIPARVKVFKE